MENMNAKYLFCLVLFLLAHGVGTDEVPLSVMEGDSVTLNTNVKKNLQEDIKWYFNDTRIAQVTGDLSDVCTDVQCKERFRDRLKLDKRTGSLTITNIRTTDSGEYKLKIFSSRNTFEKTFSVTGHEVKPPKSKYGADILEPESVQWSRDIKAQLISYVGVSSAERDELKKKSVKEGESVTLDPGVIKQANDVMTWYFNDTRIAEITGEPRKICTDVHRDGKFRDRLKLDHQTGSLTITNTTNTHSGVYELDISSSSFNIKRSFGVSVTAVPDSGLSAGAVAGIVAVVLLVAAAAAAVIYWNRKVRRKDTRMHLNDQANGVKGLSPNQTEVEPDAVSETSMEHL